MELNFNVHVHYAHGELREVRCLLENIVSQISDYVVKQKEFNDQISSDVSDIASSLVAIDGDVAALNQKIIDLQNNPADQALLDGLVVDGQALATRTAAAKVAASALDDKTAPVAPPTP